VASGWTGRRSTLLPDGSPGLAASLYLFGYYLGSSVGGALGGVAYDHAGWLGVVGYVTGLFGAALVLALVLRRVPVPQHRGTAGRLAGGVGKHSGLAPIRPR
jgi:YNFM family putative membrane transporter